MPLTIFVLSVHGRAWTTAYWIAYFFLTTERYKQYEHGFTKKNGMHIDLNIHAIKLAWSPRKLEQVSKIISYTSTTIMTICFSSNSIPPFHFVILFTIAQWALNNTKTICGFASPCFPYPSRCLLCVESSLIDSRCAPQCTQTPFLDAFYMLQLAFSRLPAAGIVPLSCHVHSTKTTHISHNEVQKFPEKRLQH